MVELELVAAAAGGAGFEASSGVLETGPTALYGNRCENCAGVAAVAPVSGAAAALCRRR